MFETLEEQMKVDEEKATTKPERFIRWSVIAVLSVILFGALYLGLHLMGS